MSVRQESVCVMCIGFLVFAWLSYMCEGVCACVLLYLSEDQMSPQL